MAGFVQIIEFDSSRIDEIKQLGESYRASRSGSDGGPRRAVFATDRDRPNHYLNIVEFESHEAAEENSARPETTEFAEQMGKLCDGPPKFYNLDVMDLWNA
jgi:quinol monooxygenase YgiN